jgi:hypothetical protein
LCRECSAASQVAANPDLSGHVPNGHLAAELEAHHRRSVLVYAVVDDSLSPTSPLGDAIETFIRREDAERFIEEVRADDRELASCPAHTGCERLK